MALQSFTLKFMHTDKQIRASLRGCQLRRIKLQLRQKEAGLLILLSVTLLRACCS